MATLTWETATAELRKALDEGIEVIDVLGPYACTVGSSQPGEQYEVWTRGRIANCSCGRSARGMKPCKHGALAFFRACWDRSTEVAP